MYRHNRILKLLAIVVLILTISAIFAAHVAAETKVSVDAPEFVSGNTFDVKIEIDHVEYLDSGKFELLFDPRVVRVTDVKAGSIDGTDIPIDKWACVQNLHTKCVIDVLFNLPGCSGVSGSGHLATINFEVTGEDGNCSSLNISNAAMVDGLLDNGELWDKEGEEIHAEWECGIVCIGDPPSFKDSTDSDSSTDSDNSTYSDNSIQDTPKAHVTVSVKNRDDDKLDIELYIDGEYKKDETVPKDIKKEYSSYTLDEGDHSFMIRWDDPDIDTDKPYDYEKTEVHYVSGKIAITLTTDEHTEDDDKLSATVYVKNLDDDDLDAVYLYIDGVYRKYKSISSGSMVEYGEYEFEGDEDALHSFKIEWFDPGTDVTYEKIVRSYITGEEAVTLYVDKHTKEDMILFPEATSTPVPTIPKPASTSTRTVKEPTPAPTKAQITELHTDPAPTGVMTQHLSATCTMLAFVAVLFVLMQIRRI